MWYLGKNYLKKKGVLVLSSSKQKRRVAKLKSGDMVEIKNFTEAIELIFDYALDLLPILSEAQFNKSYKREFIDSGYEEPIEVLGTIKSVKNDILKKAKSNAILAECDGFMVFFCSKKMGFVNEEHILLLGDCPAIKYILARIYNTEKGIRSIGMIS